MNKTESWYYDERQQVGVNYEDQAEVEAYDARHAQFRDVDAECRRILDALAITGTSVLIELGTGTGAFAIHAARRCAQVYAADVSEPMLAFAKRKAERAGCSNITFCQGGFLTYEHQGKPADALVTSMAFHHLPDFWKGIALNRMHAMLRPGGLLYLHDVIFEQEHVESNISRWIDQLREIGGDKLRDEVAAHVRKEYSTYDWIMDGLLEQAGFIILTKEMTEGVIGTYVCARE